MITNRTLEDVLTTLNSVTGISDLTELDAFPEFEADLIQPIIEEAGKLASDVLAPLNQSGDAEGAQLVDGNVISAKGFKEAYKAFQAGGWMGLSAPVEYGGQGLPQTLMIAVMELLQASNMSFALCPMLSFGAIDALVEHGTDAQKASYLPKLISGEWTGTMNLTEPQAGSDVGALKTRAIPSSDGNYEITGQKIYITWGDHDLTENVVHLVLARLPDAPEGTRGISLFLCPKFLLDENGNPGERNGVSCIGLEKKIGIHASPTCVLEFDNARAWLVGEPNNGLAAMFTMMNSARLQVGIQGAAQSEAAYQTARQFAEDRLQGRRSGAEGPAAIIRHADVQNMLLSMRARTMAARAICYECAKAYDLRESAPDAELREKSRWKEEVLTPIAKAWSTDVGVASANAGVQIHGGMGFMSETLASQIYRDVRIAPIYEGTNGIQAMDLVGRKIPMASGKAMDCVMSDIAEIIERLKQSKSDVLFTIAEHLQTALDQLCEATGWFRSHLPGDTDRTMFGATAYLEMFGRVAGTAYLARGAMNAVVSSLNSARDLVDLTLFLAHLDLSGVSGLLARVRMGDTFAYDRRLELVA